MISWCGAHIVAVWVTLRYRDGEVLHVGRVLKLNWQSYISYSSGEPQLGTFSRKICSISLLSISRDDTDYFWDEPKLLARSQKSQLAFLPSSL